ncbi:DNA-binding response regulator [Streptomyces sp. ISL-100]|uniref:helix-turn-helix transcriptional regulator n=1 Tax=Streptomyces sp. ISL-100 TaxID=2819173 RepID=UPI001BE5A6C3|nr:DNA-binding response regulator [Streptomyces sp. ISL-100]MBT2398832.1 DNA-binding response regulator [Streptomyces sp. ISL-100]
MHQSASTTTELHVLVHSGLKAHLDSPRTPFSTLRSGVDRIEFIDDDDLAAPGTVLDLPVLIPVTSEFQAECLRAVRARHPLSLLVAVTHDLTGFRTYFAIRSGANFVFNLAIPGESQIDMLYAQSRSHRMTTPAGPTGPWLRAAPGDHGGRHESHASGDARDHAGRGGPAGDERCPDPALSESDAELARMLCTPMTVSEIARSYYCSERSMYRRVRKLYDDLGVSGRTELMSLAGTLGLNQPATTRLPGPRAVRPRAC